MKGVMQNDLGLIKNIKIGFSWTTFFFGFFVPLVRGDWKWFLIMVIAGIITAGLANLVFCFIYNKIYINDLLEKGFKPADNQTEQGLIEKGFVSGIR